MQSGRQTYTLLLAMAPLCTKPLHGEKFSNFNNDRYLRSCADSGAGQ